MANLFVPMWRPSDENAEFLNKGSEAINIGDLLYWDSSNNCVRSVSNYADQGSAAAQQLALAPLFVGVAMSAALATDATQRPVRVLVDDIFEFPCDSGTFAIGDYVTFSYSAGARNQQVAGCGNAAALAIGRVVKRYSSATTKVKVRLIGNYNLGLLDVCARDPYGLLPVATIAAAGSNQGNAAALTAAVNIVTGASGTNGVILPAAQVGMKVFVCDDVATNALQVYPPSGGTLNQGSANAALTQTQKSALYIATSASNYERVLSA